MAQAIRSYPTRFAGLVAIAPQQPEVAALELERGISTLGFKGVIINSHTRGEYLDNKKFKPILEAATSLQAPIYLHPRTPAPCMIEPYLDYGLYFAGWGFSAETGLHAMRLILSGLFDEFPGLRIILGHMGEGIPFMLDRIDNRYALQVKLGSVKKLKRKPSDYFRTNFVITTSGMSYAPTLKLSIEMLGSENILFATDYPYEDMREAVSFIESVDISDVDMSIDAKEKIFHGNAEKLFELSE